MSNISLTDGQKIILNKHDAIGVNDALDDREYLINCFIDLGDLQQISDFNSKKCLLLGRTGVGKTALVTKLQNDKTDRVIVIDPEALAMQHISNSTIIKHLSELDIDLNTFFKLLWRHEICVEIFNRHTKIASDTDHDNFMEKIRYAFKTKNPKHLKALNYLEEWRDTFWKTSNSHVTKMITKKEDEISSLLGATTVGLNAKIKGKDKFTQEEVSEIKQNAQSIVNNVQIAEVMGLLDMLDDFIDFHQERYYVVIDRLDEKWVGNDIRYKLIKSLIETLRDLNRLKNIKPVATLRYDLLGRVFDISKDSGFQEEKYSPLYLEITWKKEQLINLLNERINYQFRSRYSKRTLLTYEDIFPDQIDSLPTMDYILERTLYRPRDVIEFVNFCIDTATNENEGFVSEDVVIDAEKNYSKSRLKSLYFEWFADYPGLPELIRLLKRRPRNFQIKDIEHEAVKEMCLKYAMSPPDVDIDTKDSILRLTTDVSDGKLEVDDFIKQLTHIFFRVGLIGIKESDSKRIVWNKHFSTKLEWDDFDEDTQIYIHPCYFSALKIQI